MAAWLDNWPPQLAILATVGYAMLLGGLVGIEREFKVRPAGLRTHMLVAGAAALLVGLGGIMAARYSAAYSAPLLRMDPFRLIESVVAAVGFLGAGAIFRGGGRHGVGGLTTAASLLTVASIGIAVGLHAYLLATGVTVLALVVLLLLTRIERWVGTRGGPR